MKIKEALKHYYTDEIKNTDTPPCPAELQPNSPHKSRETIASTLFRVAFAACIVIAFIPLIAAASRPSPLAVRTAEVCRNTELNAKISAGLINLYEIGYNSCIRAGNFSGGKR